MLLFGGITASKMIVARTGTFGGIVVVDGWKSRQKIYQRGIVLEWTPGLSSLLLPQVHQWNLHLRTLLQATNKLFDRVLCENIHFLCGVVISLTISFLFHGLEHAIVYRQDRGLHFKI